MEYAQITTNQNIFKVQTYYSTRPTIYAGDPNPENIMSDEDMKVINIYPVEENLPTYDSFYQSISAKVFTDWTFDSTTEIVLKQYNISNFSFAEKVEQLISDLAYIRFEKETLSVRVNGNFICTERDSQSMLTSTLIYLQQNPTKTIDWKCDDSWISLDLATVTSLTTIIPLYIEECFSRERELWDLLKAVPANDWDQLKAIDLTVGWPTNIIS